MPRDEFTLLRTPGKKGLKCTKHYRNGRLEKQKNHPKYFLSTEVPVDELNDFYEALLKYSIDPQCCMVHSKLLKPTNNKIRRIGKKFEGDSPHHIKYIDFDLPDEEPPEEWAENPVDFIRSLIRKYLPKEFHGAAVIYKFSGSMGIKPGTHVHLIFWLKTPMTFAKMKICCKYYDIPADQALFNSVQQHYIADPILENTPCPVKQRMGLIEGHEVDIDPSALPVMVKNSNSGSAPFLNNSGEIHQGTRNTTITRVGGLLRSIGWDKGQIAQCLWEINQEKCNPPLQKNDVEKIAVSVSGYDPKHSHHDLDDRGNAYRLRDNFTDTLLWDSKAKRPYFYNEKRWVEDPPSWLRRVHQIKEVTEAELLPFLKTYSVLLSLLPSPKDSRSATEIIFLKAGAEKFIASLGSARKIADAEKLFRPYVSVNVDEFDRDIFLFNTDSGTYNLENGDLQEHKPSDKISHIALIEHDIKAPADRWKQFIEEICLGDVEMAKALQKIAGYCLSGDVSEQKFFLLVGTGGNGKSVLVEILALLMGSYACMGPPGLLVEKRHDKHPTEIYDLKGRRVIFCSETNDGAKFNADKLKKLTGDETIKARPMRGDFVEFPMYGKLVLLTNNLPRITGRDRGIWRRIFPLKFDAIFEGRNKDKNLKSKLKAELPGILNWAIEGFKMYQEEGLELPASSQVLLEQYKEQEDVLKDFTDAWLHQDPGSRVALTEVLKAYKRVCQTENYPVIFNSTMRLANALKDRGYKVGKLPPKEWEGPGDGQLSTSHIWGVELKHRGGEHEADVITFRGSKLS